MQAHAAIPTFRALKHYSDDAEGRRGHARPRDDVLIHFLTQRNSVTSVDSLEGDYVDRPPAYCAGPMVLVELRGGAVTHEGFVFTECNELLRESVDRVSYIDWLSDSHPNLEAELTTTLPEPSPEIVVLLGCQRVVNYFHWWIDVLAKCWVICNSPYRACRLVTPPLTQAFQRDSLLLLKQSVTPLTRRLQRFRYIVFARGLTYGSSQAIAPQVIESAQWCRTTLELSPPPRGRKLFLSRRAARSRRLLNEDEVIAALGTEFEPVELETMSVKKQASLFSEASVVVAPHGAGLTNLLFCTQPTAVVELVHDDPPPYTYRRLAGLLGHPYLAVGCTTETDERRKPGRRDMRASTTDVVAAVARLQESNAVLR